MHYGSSKEEASEKEARAQDRRGEEIDGEEDGHRPSQDRSQEIAGEGRGGSGSRACPFIDRARLETSNIGANPKP